jgi:hypothetical protein
MESFFRESFFRERGFRESFFRESFFRESFFRESFFRKRGFRDSFFREVFLGKGVSGKSNHAVLNQKRILINYLKGNRFLLFVGKSRGFNLGTGNSVTLFLPPVGE